MYCIVCMCVCMYVCMYVCVRTGADCRLGRPGRCGRPARRRRGLGGLRAQDSGGTKEGQWVLRTPLQIRALVFLCSAWFKNPGFVLRPLCPYANASADFVHRTEAALKGLQSNYTHLDWLSTRWPVWRPPRAIRCLLFHLGTNN